MPGLSYHMQGGVFYSTKRFASRWRRNNCSQAGRTTITFCAKCMLLIGQKHQHSYRYQVLSQDSRQKQCTPVCLCSCYISCTGLFWVWGRVLTCLVRFPTATSPATRTFRSRCSRLAYVREQEHNKRNLLRMYGRYSSSSSCASHNATYAIWYLR